MVARIWFNNFSLFETQVRLVLYVYRDLVEESVDRRAQAGKGLHRPGEILLLVARASPRARPPPKRMQRPSPRRVPAVRHRARRRSSPRAPCPCAPRRERCWRRGHRPSAGSCPPRCPRKDCSASTRASRRTQIVLVAQREHGVDHIVPHALVAHLHLEALGEEVEQVGFARRTLASGRRSLFSTTMRITPSAARRSA